MCLKNPFNAAGIRGFICIGSSVFGFNIVANWCKLPKQENTKTKKNTKAAVKMF